MDAIHNKTNVLDYIFIYVNEERYAWFVYTHLLNG